MADQVTGKIEPSVLGGQDIYQFTLDGMATAAQMDRLIELSKDLVKKLVGEDASSLKNLGAQAKSAGQSLDSLTEATEDLADAQRKNTQELNEASGFLRNVWTRNFSLALDGSDKALSLFTGAVGFAYTGLTNYSKSLTEGLKRGVAGNTFDLAIAAKSAGVSLTTFTKALGESGGGFASLGDGATDGAMQFGYLVKRVREATASVGNLGFTNDELAALTAQQTKIAVAQGFKGRQAQEAVIRNTRILGAELDNLAARTGKSTLELAQAAAKIAQDPLVASFVKTAKAGSKEVSAAIQSLAASLRGIFGEEGDKVVEDALKSAVSGLPFIVTQTGKNMILASNGMYQEFERLAQRAAQGEQITEQDRQRLRDMAQEEVKVRGDQLRQFAMLGGPVGESANQILKLAKEAEFYNSEEGKRERRRSDAAKRFNTELNKLQASLQEALIPVLQALNLIDWATVFKVVSYIPMKIAEFIEGFRAFVKDFPLLGDGITFLGEVFGKLLGAGLGLFTVIGLVATAFTVFNKTVGAIQTMFGALGKEIGVQNTKYGIVGKALDVFAQALQKASVAVTGRGVTGTGAGRGGRAAAAAATAAAAAEVAGSTRIGGFAGLGQAEKDLAAQRAADKQSALARAAELRRQDPSISPADALRRAKEDVARQHAQDKLSQTARPAPTVGDTFGLDRRIAEQKAREELASQRARERTDREQARQDRLRKERIERAAEIRRQQPGISQADALRQAAEAQAKREALLNPLRRGYESARTATIGVSDKARGAWAKATPALGSIGEKMMSPKGIGIGMAAGIGLDLAAEAAKASGNEGAAKALDVGSSTIGMAGTGAMIGSMIAPGVGTAVGAALGGLVGGLTSIWKNYLSEDSASISKAMSDEQLAANEKREKEVRDSYEANRKIIEELRALREESGYGNQINSRGVAYAASTERKIADLRFSQG